jgi:hypothetical protein
MVETGQQYVILAACSFTVNDIFSKKNTCSCILFLSTAESVEDFSLFCILLFTQHCRHRIFLYKTVVDISLFHNIGFEKCCR